MATPTTMSGHALSVSRTPSAATTPTFGDDVVPGAEPDGAHVQIVRAMPPQQPEDDRVRREGEQADPRHERGARDDPAHELRAGLGQDPRPKDPISAPLRRAPRACQIEPRPTM